MRYSLSSRFRGALVGAALGDLFGSVIQQQRREKITRGDSPTPDWLGMDAWWLEALNLSPNLPAWGTLITKLTHELVQEHSPDWQQLLPSIETALAIAPPPGKIAGMAIATLPLALYHHEDLNQQRSHLQKALLSWQAPPITIEIAFALGTLFSQSLQEHELSLQRLVLLQQDAMLPTLSPFLSQVHSSLMEGHSLSTTLLQFKQLDINRAEVAAALTLALAVFCLFRTPDDLHLSLQSAARAGLSSRVLCTLVGAISGCQNAMVRLPPHWQQGLEISAFNLLWGVHSISELSLLAERLWTTWAGVAPASQRSMHIAIAAPQVIRVVGR